MGVLGDPLGLNHTHGNLLISFLLSQLESLPNHSPSCSFVVSAQDNC